VILLSRESIRNEPLGLNNIPARTSRSSLPPPFLSASSRRQSQVSVKKRKKTTPNGKIILEPQPEDTLNDPLNWPFWRRNAALFSLGFYCMILGGLTPVLAAGFGQVAATFHVSTPKVALTTGIYMLGLGLGGVLVSPTAIIVGKRPSLVAARFFQGMSVSPGEVLPSATVAEIFFLHERAFRLGIYTLLLIGGKNLVPVASAMIIEAAGWRWVFW
jgi:MFS family permease